MPAVTIITQCYNYEQYLEECVRSVQAQTFRDFEHLVLNVGCNPLVYRLADRYNFGAVEWIREFGLCSGKNWLARLARSKYILNLDADDRIRPNFLQQLMARAESRTVVGCGMQEFDGGSNGGFFPEPITYDDLRQGNKIFCCALYPKKEFLIVGGYDTALEELGFEDWELWLSLTRHGCKVKIVPEILYEHRGDAMTGSRNSLMVRLAGKHEARMKYLRWKHGVSG